MQSLYGAWRYTVPLASVEFVQSIANANCEKCEVVFVCRVTGVGCIKMIKCMDVTVTQI